MTDRFYRGLWNSVIITLFIGMATVALAARPNGEGLLIVVLLCVVAGNLIELGDE